MILPKKVIAKLKKPLGKTHVSLAEIKRLSKTHKIIAVGDICVLALLGIGIRPHLAVFDYMYMRKELPDIMIGVFEREFTHMVTITNKAGTLSDTLNKRSKEFIKKGGAIRIKGEEDLTALPFIRDAEKNMVIVYGQPHEGIVVVHPTKKVKEFAEKILT